jgi:hypothetical protein
LTKSHNAGRAGPRAGPSGDVPDPRSSWRYVRFQCDRRDLLPWRSCHRRPASAQYSRVLRAVPTETQVWHLHVQHQPEDVLPQGVCATLSKRSLRLRSPRPAPTPRTGAPARSQYMQKHLETAAWGWVRVAGRSWSGRMAGSSRQRGRLLYYLHPGRVGTRPPEVRGVDLSPIQLPCQWGMHHVADAQLSAD